MDTIFDELNQRETNEQEEGNTTYDELSETEPTKK